jgi:hypothetical protein
LVITVSSFRAGDAAIIQPGVVLERRMSFKVLAIVRKQADRGSPLKIAVDHFVSEASNLKLLSGGQFKLALR